jgi:hypothetical protein
MNLIFSIYIGEASDRVILILFITESRLQILIDINNTDTIETLFMCLVTGVFCCEHISVADPGCLSRIPDPTFFYPGSELSPSRIRIEEFKYFNPTKWFLSSRKYDPGCSSRIPDPDADFLPIPDPGSRGQKGTGSRIRIRITGTHGWKVGKVKCEYDYFNLANFRCGRRR